MARTKYTNVDKAMAWARSVLKGKFPACRYIHQAIERHFDDVAANDVDNKRMSERFQAWVNTGHLVATPGAEVDYREILEDTKEANKLAPIRESPIDPHGATGLSHDLDDQGFNPITAKRWFWKRA